MPSSANKTSATNSSGTTKTLHAAKKHTPTPTTPSTGVHPHQKLHIQPRPNPPTLPKPHDRLAIQKTRQTTPKRQNPGRRVLTLSNPPNNVLTLPNLNTMAKERTGSPDQKPLTLYEYIILARSNPGDLILDHYAVSATTLIAAHKHQRRWIGIDLRPDTHRHTCSRRNQFTPPLKKIHHKTTPPPTHRHPPNQNPPPPKTPPNQPTQTQPTQQQIRDVQIKQYRLQCWTCRFITLDPRYLELVHITPKASGGTNHLDNGNLLCTPLQQRKSR